MKLTSEPGSSLDPRSIQALLERLMRLPALHYSALGPFEVNGRAYNLPKFTFVDTKSPEPIRIGLFGGIHGDEPAGAHALVELLTLLSKDPQLADGFQLQVYPLCNPTGFEDNTRHSRSGRDLNREFWKQSTQPEVRILEQELQQNRFSGVLQLHADDTSEGIYGFVKGHTLTENLLRPALREAGKILPRNVNATIDGFAARDGIIFDVYEGVLAPPARMEPVPFEIVLETPHSAPLDLQVQALVVAIRTILSEYRQLIAFAANI
jgi:murein peptide amidase A